MQTHVIILAGGKGTRMKSDCPKVLVELGGKPLISRLLEAVTPVCLRPTVIVGYGSDKVMAALGDRCEYAHQAEQLGTGHAVSVARKDLDRPDIRNIIVLYGDHPLVSEETVRALVARHEEGGGAVTIATVTVPSFEGDFQAFYHYGRIIRGEEGEVQGIVELKDATDAERAVREVNPGYYCFNARWLWDNIKELENNNKAKEYYLTDMIGIAVKKGERIATTTIQNPPEGMGVNTIEELHIAEKYLSK